MKEKHLLQLDVLIQGNNLPLQQIPACPALEKLLGLATLSPPQEKTFSQWLLQSFGLPAGVAAPHSALGHGLPAQQGYWLRADPVYLHLMRDRIILPQPVVDDLSAEETQALVQTLNAHFTELHFYAPHPQRWYVHTATPQQIITREPEQVVGQDIRPNMPQGADGKVWVGRLNEVQMLLHQHRVNEAREAVGKLPVNGLWLWGGGGWQGPAIKPYERCWGDDPLLAGVAIDSTSPLPMDLQSCLRYPAENQLLLLDERLSWEVLEQSFFAPLLKALKAKHLQTLRLLFAYQGKVVTCTIHGKDMWKFWRSAKGVNALFKEGQQK